MTCRMLLLPLAAVLLLFANLPLSAQMDSTQCTLRVDVVNVNGSRMTAPLRVELTQGFNNIPVSVTLTNDTGTAEFENLRSGQYRVKVTGDSIEPAESGTIEIEGGRAFVSQMVAVRLRKDDSSSGTGTGSQTVDVADLNIPKNAVDEYNRASKLIADRHFDKAIKNLSHAIALYPKFCSAYNNLAVCYYQLGQKNKEREALEKAVSTNSNCIPPMVSLARIAVEQDRNPAEAQKWLGQVFAAEPNNVEAMVFQARVYLMENNFDQAIAEADKVHALPHKGEAIVHYVAASAYQHKGDNADAIKELQLFLKEEPPGSRANLVRKQMEALEKEPH